MDERLLRLVGRVCGLAFGIAWQVPYDITSDWSQHPC